MRSLVENNTAKLEMRLIETVLIFLFIPFVASAQFYVTGDDPGHLKWNYIETGDFRIIYPEGADSLARTYGQNLEKFKIPVSRSVGFKGGDGDGKKMPVVLHTYNTSNGSVAWAPKRMDLFTIPTAYNPEPLPWAKMLAVHEGRHVTQMQFGMTGNQRPFGFAFGQMWNIFVSLAYPGLYYLEGDAVVAETALTNSGRGRTADFLNYYRVAFDQGDYRNWDRWQYGSQKHYTPNHYALGYMSLAASRYLYDYPEIMKDGYNRITKQIFDFSPFHHMIRKKSGLSNKESFKQICEKMEEIWSEDDRNRAPFIPMEPVTAEPKRYTDYGNTNIIGQDIYTIKQGFDQTPTLVRISPTGKETFVTRFPYDISNLQYHDGKLYWSEKMPDKRWSMKSNSRIRSLDLKTSRKKTLTPADELLFNPSYSEEEMCSTQYFQKGGSAINVEGEKFMAPEGVQIVETAWIGNIIYSSGLSDEGFGIYSLDPDNGVWKTVLEAQPVKITNFGSEADELAFVCDRTGVNEIYHFDPRSGKLRQRTSTPYGATDFCYNEDGTYLYYSSQTLNGMRMFRTPVDSLINREVDYTDLHNYILADKLSEQEKELAQKEGEETAVKDDVEVTFSEPKRYRKISNMFNIHSWAPVYVSVDNIMNMSFDHIYQAASLGVSAIMQNTLSTGVGEFGYSAHKDPYDKSKWRHSGHFKYTYSGLYPVIETSVDFNDRAARQNSVKKVVSKEGSTYSMSSKALDTPYIEGKLSMYIPFNLSSGGWKSGFIPKVSYKISNDKFNSNIAVLTEEDSSLGKNPLGPAFFEVIYGKNTFRHSLSGSVRGYTSLPVPNSAVYPRFGIGAEIGASGELSSGNILSPMGYVYGYGYLPGVTRTQGLKLSVLHQQKLDRKAIFGYSTVSILPRGLSDNAYLSSWISSARESITKLSADYAIPIYIGDISIGRGFIYIKRLTLTPHMDYTMAKDIRLMSVGTSLTFDLNSIIWIGWPVSIGATYSYNGLCDFNQIRNSTGIEMKKNHVGFIFNVSF